MKISDYLASVLKHHNVKTIFGYQGGNITRIIDAVTQHDIQYIQMFHEQSAAFAACAYAQTLNQIGVAVSSSGPGAMNLITGIANAYYDSIPCLFITGNVNSRYLLDDTNQNIRQKAFQEANIVEMVKPITKYATKILSANTFSDELIKAIECIKQDRPGPVLLDIPHDIQWNEINPPISSHCSTHTSIKMSSTNEKQLLDIFSQAKKPLVIIGGGMQGMKCSNEIYDFLCKINIPMVSSLRGLSILSSDHPQYLGMIGDYGTLYANQALKEADVLLVLGSRMDERQISADLTGTKIIRVDIDDNELNCSYEHALKINMPLIDFLDWLSQQFEQGFEFSLSALEWVDEFKSINNSIQLNSTEYYLHTISKLFDENAIVCADVGLHQMAAAKAIQFKQGQLFLTSAGLGSMGYALPAAIGASFANKSRPVICIVGDGGLQMNMQELQMISAYQLPIHIILINNQSLGMIAQYQEKALNQRFIGSIDGYYPANFERIATAYNLPYYQFDISTDLINQSTTSLLQDRFSLIELRCSY